MKHKDNCCFGKEHHNRLPRTIIKPGPTGPTGPTGATGVTGIAGESIEVKSTNTIGANEKAKVVVTHKNNSALLDFFIPKGVDGTFETIRAGKTKKVEATDNAEVVDRYEDDVHYFDFKIPKGDKGATGLQGPKGEQGEPGRTGPQGPKGDKGDIGEKGDTGDIGPQGPQGEVGPKGETGEKGATGPQGEKGETGERGPQGERGEQGPRGFPGEIGISQAITIDGTETVGPDESAEVQDDFESNVHHLTFYIPQGPTGAKGEAGEKGQVGAKGETGPQGPTGPQGAEGAAGPAGLTPDVNATIYCAQTQTISNGNNVLLNSTLTNNGMRIEDNSIYTYVAGTYLISFSINNASSPTSGDCVGIAVNDNLIEATCRPLTASTNTSATIVAKLNGYASVSLQAKISQNRSLYASGSPSAMLTVMLISY